MCGSCIYRCGFKYRFCKVLFQSFMSLYSVKYLVWIILMMLSCQKLRTQFVPILIYKHVRKHYLHVKELNRRLFSVPRGVRLKLDFKITLSKFLCFNYFHSQTQ